MSRQTAMARATWLAAFGAALTVSACGSTPPAEAIPTVPLPLGAPSPDPPTRSSAVVPPQMQQSGVLFAGRGFTGQDRHDLAVLALLVRGQVLAVDAGANCEHLAEGARIEVVSPTDVEMVVQHSFSNEANTCIGHPLANPALEGRHVIAVRGIVTDPVVAAPAPDTTGMEAEARAELAARSGGVLVAGRFGIAISFQHHRYRNTVYSVAEMQLSPRPGCTHLACRRGMSLFEQGAHSAVAVFASRSGQPPVLRFLRFRVVTEEDPGEPYGMVSFAGFVAPRGVDEPWTVLLWDGGPSWDFELIVPRANGSWNPAALGAGSSTI